jgi:GT2 family glycosyltransferase
MGNLQSSIGNRAIGNRQLAIGSKHCRLPSTRLQMLPPAPVSVVIPSWNGRQLLEQFLPSVVGAASHHRETTGGDVEIVVVDDASTDGSVEWVRERARTLAVPVRVVAHETNLGFAAACNRGVAEASHPLVGLFNNDVALEREAISRLAANFGADDRSGSRLFAVHCRVLDFDTGALAGAGQVGRFKRGFIRVHDRYSPPADAAGPHPSIFASGGSSMVDRHLFLGLGGFDSLFAPFYLEDVELSYRAWKRGFRVAYAPDALARHRFSSTIGKSSSAARIRRVSQRNRLFLNWIHLHDHTWVVQHLFWIVVLAVTSPLTLRFDFIRGLIEALGHVPEIRKRRQTERTQARRSDRDVMREFRDR